MNERNVAGTPGRSPVGAIFLGSPDQAFEGAVGLGTGQEALTSAHYLRSNTVQSLTFRTVQSLASSEERGQQDQGRGCVAADMPTPQRAESQQQRDTATFLGPTQVSLLSCWRVCDEGCVLLVWRSSACMLVARTLRGRVRMTRAARTLFFTSLGPAAPRVGARALES